jgi:hypothetical protein
MNVAGLKQGVYKIRCDLDEFFLFHVAARIQ